MGHTPRDTCLNLVGFVEYYLPKATPPRDTCLNSTDVDRTTTPDNTPPAILV